MGSNLKKLQQSLLKELKKNSRMCYYISIMLADNLQLDIEQIIEEKLEKK